MIVQKYVKGDVVSFRLTTGEEIVARIENDNGDSYEVKAPVILYTEPSTGKVGVAPLMISADKTHNINIQRSAVCAVVKTAQEVVSDYLNITTGIKTPAKPSIII